MRDLKEDLFFWFLVGVLVAVLIGVLWAEAVLG
jgi:hypothetical protein